MLTTTMAGNCLRKFLYVTPFLLLAARAEAVFLDGEGHYGLRPETQTNPGFQDNRGLYQGIFQTFRLLGEARANEKLSFNLDFRIFDDPRTAFMGDTAEPEDCSNVETARESDPPSNDPNAKGKPISGDDGKTRKEQSNRGNNRNCKGRHQNSGEPGYETYTPKIAEAYVRYGFDFCLLEAGRRSRDWGMGIFLDSGHDPYETSRSTFDGVNCNINLQKTQTLGFSVGFDKLSETGTSVDVGLPSAESDPNGGYGSSKLSDDLDQLFFTIEYDDRKANAGSRFTRHVGIYFANIFGNERLNDESKAKTDLKYADVFTAFYFGDLALRNEVLFRLGRSSDPSWSRYGGTSSESDGSPVKNDLNSIGFAGDFTWTIAKSGAAIGPVEYNQGNSNSHDWFFEYALAPGDRDGYSREYYRAGQEDVEATRAKAGSTTSHATAMAFHRNFKPALILFNGPPTIDDMRVDGAFDPGRVMNATVFGTGYHYKSVNNGNFTFKLISAELSSSMPRSAKDRVRHDEAVAAANRDADRCDDSHSCDAGERPVGFGGRHLGYEVDLIYSHAFGKDVEVGGAGAVAIPGPAWKVRPHTSPEISYLIQGLATFKF